MQTIKLNTGAEMPALGLGTWMSKPGEVGAAVEHAFLNANYLHLDCAMVYGNEKEIGQSLGKVWQEGAEQGITREDVFVTSKLWNTHHHPENVQKGCEKTLADLQLDYLDLYLVHWAIAAPLDTYVSENDSNGIVKREQVPMHETWAAMEKLVEQGLVKTIGVANFTAVMINDLLSYAKVKPAMNQIELHPYNQQQALVDFCRSEDIAITAYSPLGSPGNASAGEPRLLDDEVIAGIAKTYDKTPAQVLIRWAIERGTITIPKSTNPKRIDENIDVFDFELTEDEMKQIAALDKAHRYVDPSQWWGLPYFE